MSPLLPSFLGALGLAPAEVDLALVGGEPLWRGPLRVDELAVAAVAAALVGGGRARRDARRGAGARPTALGGAWRSTLGTRRRRSSPSSS
jgi:hypothetical protein